MTSERTEMPTRPAIRGIVRLDGDARIDERPRKPARKRVLAVAAVVAILAAGVVVGIRMRSRDLVAEAVARARRLGMPTEPEDLQIAPAPADQDSSSLYQSNLYQSKLLRSRIAHKKRARTTIRALNEYGVGGSSRLAAGEALHLLSFEFPAAEKATSRPRFTPRLTWDEGELDESPAYPLMDFWGRLLGARARYRAESGLLAGAFQDIDRITVMFRHSQSGPSHVGPQAGCALARAWLAGVRQVAGRCGGDPHALERLGRSARGLDGIDGRLALKDELVRLRLMLKEIRSGKLRPSHFVSLRGSAAITAVEDSYYSRGVDQAEAMCIDYMVDLILVWPDAARAPARIAAFSRDTEDRPLQPGRRLAGVAALAEPQYPPSKLLYYQWQSMACFRSGRIALQALAYQARYGRWPTLHEAGKLAAASCTDPFGGRDLVYRAKPHRLQVYSVGENLKDDGGRAGGSAEAPDEGVFDIQIGGRP